MAILSGDYGRKRPIPPTAKAAGPSHSRLRGRRRSPGSTATAAKISCSQRLYTHRKSVRLRPAGIAAVIVGIAAVAGAVYCMVRGLGLNQDLDFGAGAYYYADIPEYGTVLNWDVYTAQLPFWVYLLLFLAWGYLMWRLWKRMEK